jgi:hypothetical protein
MLAAFVLASGGGIYLWLRDTSRIPTVPAHKRPYGAPPEISPGSNTTMPEGGGTIVSPFLGKLNVRLANREFKIALGDGSSVLIPFSVATLPDGRFVSATFTRPGATAFWPSPEQMESNFRVAEKEITGLPSDDGMPILPTVLERLKEQIELEKAACIRINYVMFRRGNDNDRAVFIAGVYGVKQLEFGTQLPAEERFKRIHYFFDGSGKLLFGSN